MYFNHFLEPVGTKMTLYGLNEYSLRFLHSLWGESCLSALKLPKPVTRGFAKSGISEEAVLL